MSGETITAGWRSEEVFQALDLCLACKGCKSDCPVGVDMATYKSEFLSHYWKGRLRPRSAYAFGLIPWWARAASLAPGLVNFFTQTPGLSALARSAAGIAPARKIPRFAARTFRAWFESRGPSLPSLESRSPVLLFPDTFNNFFQPETAKAAVEVLEAAGFRVTIPSPSSAAGARSTTTGCSTARAARCGRFFASFARRSAAGLRSSSSSPPAPRSSGTSFPASFPDDEDAARLSRQTHVLSEFLRKAPGFRPPPLARRAILQGHCHQRAIMKMTDEEELLRQMGIEFTIPEPGCCGMAGAFGFERGEHYDLSMSCGEKALLPEIRRAPPDTLVIADGFSCREQIRQGTSRETHSTSPRSSGWLSSCES